MVEPRRVRTQVERDADGTAWRHIVGVNPDDPELACVAHMFDDEFAPYLAAQLRDPEVRTAYEQEMRPLRRRWWHRYTRRTR